MTPELQEIITQVVLAVLALVAYFLRPKKANN